MSPATSAEWLGAFALGTGAYVPGALLILGLDHDFRVRLPHVNVEPALVAAEQAAHRARLQLAGLLLLLAWHLNLGEATR
ncbi:hypothetical protein [Streptomyces flaveolus]|uniref:hypothetical protein n=1 Tax=Streptomyces flaveolus TaxID=67297 RepID=UPI00342790B1